jgi:hypothetical protein
MITSTVIFAAAFGAAAEWCGTELIGGGHRASWRFRRSRAGRPSLPRFLPASERAAEGAD